MRKREEETELFVCYLLWLMGYEEELKQDLCYTAFHAINTWKPRQGLDIEACDVKVLEDGHGVQTLIQRKVKICNLESIQGHLVKAQSRKL